MKNISVIIAISWIFIGCSPEPQSELIGTWKIEEQLVDPGDGSGVFETVESDKTITFNSNNEIESNGDLCFMGLEVTNGSSGTYNDSSMIIDAGCNGSTPLEMTYSLSNGKLIISYPCFEACQEKYTKL